MSWLAAAVFSWPGFAADTRLVRETEALSPAEEEKRLHVPEGFAVQLFASEPMINKPINMAFDARGRLWVSSTVEYPFAATKERWADDLGTRVKDSRDAIKILEDADGDGRADKVTDFADGLNIPTGVLPWRKPEHKAGCIAFSIPNIWYFADTDGDDRADIREVLFGPLGYEKDTHGMCSSFRLGLDGWVYATHGFNNTSHFKAKDGSTLELHSGNVFRFRPDGSRVELYTSGQVNPFGLCWDRYGNLYSADCHSNPITQLIRGACYPSFGKPHDGLGFAPVMCEHSHGSTGLCGIIYIDGGVWGKEWDDRMLVGNCVTSKVNHDKITFTGSTPKANEAPDFLTSDDPWFRPVDLQLGPDNALYIADFYNRIIGHYEVPLDHPGRDRERGRIWRVGKKGAAAPPCDFTQMDAKAIAAECGSPNLTRRHLALGEVRLRGTKNWIPGFLTIFDPKLQVKPQGDGRPKSFTDPSARPSDIVDDEIWPEKKDLRAAFSLWALSYLGERYLISRVLRECHSGGTWVEDEFEHEGEQLRGLLMSQAVQIIGSQEKLHPWEKWNLGVVFDFRGSSAGRAASSVLLSHRDYLGDDPRWHAWQIRLLLDLLDAMNTQWKPREMIPQVIAGDPSYVQAMRILLRDQLSHPGMIGIAAKRSVSGNTWFRELLHGVPTAEAASFLFDAWQKNPSQAGGGELLGLIARNADEATLLKAIAKGREILRDHDAAAAVAAIHNSLLERGVKPPAPFVAWATELAQTLLASAESDSSHWSPLPYAGIKSADFPWCFQQRKDTSGRNILVLSSLSKELQKAEQLTGVLRSKPFAVPERLSFYLCGHQGFPTAKANQKNLVRLVDEKGGVLKQEFPPRNDTAIHIEWDLSSIKGRQVRFEIVDGDEGKAYAWIGAGSFEPPVIAVHTFQSSDTRRKQLESLAAILRTTAPVGLRDKLAPYLPAAVVPAKPPPRPELDALIKSRAAALAKAKPDEAKGGIVFKNNCAVCHQIKGEGGLIGPQLDGIGNRGAERLIEDILDPNRNVDAHFFLHQLKLRDGSTAIGFVRGETGQVKILADAAGNEQRIAKSNIAEDTELPQSLMPPVFGQSIAEKDFQDLTAWLLKR